MAKTAVEAGAPLNPSFTPDEALRAIRMCLREEWNMEYNEVSQTFWQNFLSNSCSALV